MISNSPGSCSQDPVEQLSFIKCGSAGVRHISAKVLLPPMTYEDSQTV